MGQGVLDIVVLGRIGAPFGVQGWLHVYSFTSPPENIVEFPLWYLKQGDGWETREILDIRPHGKHFVVKLEHIQDRTEAQKYTNCEFGVTKEDLPALPEGEYYWSELIGLNVETEKGEFLGRVTALLETGANDVLVVTGEKEHLIPYVPDHYVISVDLAHQKMVVDWDPEF